MTKPNRLLSRRESLALGGTSLMALASCTPGEQKNTEPDPQSQTQVVQIKDLENAHAEAMKMQREFGEALVLAMKNMKADAAAQFQESQKAAEARTTAERTARTAYEAQLVQHIKELAAKVTDLTQQQKDKIIEDAKPFTPPARTPEEIEQDRKREEEKEKREKEQQEMMLALLAIFFSPILAAILGAMTGKKEGLDDEESKEFAEHLATGKKLSKATEEKVAKSKTLSDMDASVTKARQQDPNPGKPRTPTPGQREWLKKVGTGYDLPETNAEPPPGSSDK